MNTLEKISAGMDDYTKSERRIADFIINHVLAFTINPIGSVSEELGVSKTTMLRFAKKMGFEGYFDFRKQVQQEELSRSSTAERFKQLGSNLEADGIQRLFVIESENLSQCVKGLDQKLFSRCVDSIIAAGTVYTAGWEHTTFLSELMSYRMRSYGYSFEHISSERSSLIFSMTNAGPEDMLIVIDMPEYSPVLGQAVGYAGSLGMKVVLITDYVTCPLIKDADMVFYCDSQTDFMKNSLNAPLFFINLLIHAVVRKDDKKIMEFLQKLDHIRELEKTAF